MGDTSTHSWGRGGSDAPHIPIPPEEESLASLCRYTYQLYHAALFDVRCNPTPLTGFSPYAAAGGAEADEREKRETTSGWRRSSNGLAGSSSAGQGEGKEGAGAFLERCHVEYANLMAYGHVDGATARRFVRFIRFVWFVWFVWFIWFIGLYVCVPMFSRCVSANSTCMKGKSANGTKFLP